jgi:hypothetical protein
MFSYGDTGNFSNASITNTMVSGNFLMKDFPINLMTAQVPYIGLVHGLIGVFLFRFRNANKDLINTISVATIGIFVTEIVFFEVNETIGLLTWGIFGLGLLTAYGLRFKNKRDKQIIDFLKLIAIGLVICYPLNFFAWTLHKNNLDILIALDYLIVPLTGTIYFYDRWILKPEKMKTKFVTILIIQSVIILIALIYAFVQNGIAIEMRQEAARAQQQANENAEKARELSVRLENCR